MDLIENNKFYVISLYNNKVYEAVPRLSLGIVYVKLLNGDPLGNYDPQVISEFYMLYKECKLGNILYAKS